MLYIKKHQQDSFSSDFVRKSAQEPSDFRTIGQFGSARLSVGKKQKFWTSARPSVGKSKKFCPNADPCWHCRTYGNLSKVRKFTLLLPLVK